MGPGTGGDKPRPYEEAEGGSVGADFISARCPRVGCTFGERTPLWRTEPSNPGTNWKLVPGGHTGRPYEETEGGSVGADFISARTALLCRMHPRRTHPPQGVELSNPDTNRDPVSVQPPPSQVRLIAGHVLQTAVQQRAQVRQGVGGNGQVLL